MLSSAIPYADASELIKMASENQILHKAEEKMRMRKK